MISRVCYVVSIMLIQGFWQFVCSTDDTLEMLAMVSLLLSMFMLVCGILSEKEK